MLMKQFAVENRSGGFYLRPFLRRLCSTFWVWRHELPVVTTCSLGKCMRWRVS